MSARETCAPRHLLCCYYSSLEEKLLTRPGGFFEFVTLQLKTSLLSWRAVKLFYCILGHTGVQK